MNEETGLFKHINIKKPTSTEDWLKMTEARVDMIKLHLNDFTLLRLGGVRCGTMDGSGYCSEILSDHLPGEDLKPWDNQGIYFLDESRVGDVKTGSNGKFQLWGLRRDKNWVLGTIHYAKLSADSKEKPRQLHTCHWWLKLNSLEMELVSLKILISCFGSSVWSHLGKEIMRWHSQTSARFIVTTRLSEMVKTENKILASAK